MSHCHNSIERMRIFEKLSFKKAIEVFVKLFYSSPSQQLRTKVPLSTGIHLQMMQKKNLKIKPNYRTVSKTEIRRRFHEPVPKKRLFMKLLITQRALEGNSIPTRKLFGQRGAFLKIRRLLIEFIKIIKWQLFGVFPEKALCTFGFLWC